MLKLAVVGRNIAYSQSPFIHGEFGQVCNMAVDYSIQDVAAGSFSEKTQQLRQDGFSGCNITVPFKEEAFAMATEASAWAKDAKAANTFLFQDERIYADNTDGRGLVHDITKNLKYELAGKRILVCGAGGAVRGILAPLRAANPETLIIANRSKKTDLGTVPYETLADQTFDVIIDGTSLKAEALSLPGSLQLGHQALVYDLKYGVDSFILTWGRKRGAIAADGLGMLVEQAALSFALWTGQQPETESVLLKLREQLCR